MSQQSGTGQDAATFHWKLTMSAKIFDRVRWQAMGARVVPAISPEVTLVELQAQVSTAQEDSTSLSCAMRSDLTSAAWGLRDDFLGHGFDVKDLDA